MRDMASPKTTPSNMDTLNESKKMPIPVKMEETNISVPWNCDKVLWEVSIAQPDDEFYSLVHDDTDGIVQQTFSEDDGVQLRVDLVLIEDSEDCDWVGGGKSGAEDQALDERDF